MWIFDWNGGLSTEPYEGKGYHLYQDHYYDSVHQTNELLQKLISLWNNQSESWITERHDRRGKEVEERRGHFS